MQLPVLVSVAQRLSFQCKGGLSDNLKYAATNDSCRYIAELAPPSIRGRLVGFYEIGSQGAQMCGFWVNYVVNRTISAESRLKSNDDMTGPLLTVDSTITVASTPRDPAFAWIRHAVHHPFLS